MHPNPGLADDQEQRANAPVATDMAPFADIPGSIWTAYLSAWALLFGIFILAFTTDGRATLAVLTASFFALMTLGLPAALAGVADRQPRSRRQRIETRSGPLPVAAAATQILLIPVGAVIGIIAFVILAK